MRIQLVRCFANQIIPGQITYFKDLRRLDFAKALHQVRLFRDSLINRGVDITFLGHSEAYRTAQALTLATIGIGSIKSITEISNIYLPEEYRIRELIDSIIQYKKFDFTTWSEAETSAVKGAGKLGARSILNSLRQAKVTSGTAIIFTHQWPLINAYAACLASEDEHALKSTLGLKVEEGDSLIVDGSKVTHLPLAV